MNKFYQTLFVLPLSGVAALVAAPSLAANFSTSGAIRYTSSPPTNLKESGTENSFYILFFEEDQNYYLHNSLFVDIKNPGTYSNNSSLSSGTISSRTLIDSYFLHANPPGTQRTKYSGSITFDDEILGIITRGNTLYSTDFLGLNNITYAAPKSANKNRGILKGDVRPDSLTLSSNRRTLNLNLTVGTAVDQIRVITEHSAAPNLYDFDLSRNVINEGSSVTAYLKATDPNKDTISFYVDGNKIGTDYDRTGTRSYSKSLTGFKDDGTYQVKGQARDEDGKYSNTRYETLTVRNVAPTLSNLTIPTINEGQSARAYLYGTDPGADALTFFLEGGNIGTDYDKSGTRSVNTDLGVFTDNGTFNYTGQVKDDDGAYSSTRNGTLIVNNVAPTITNFEIEAPKFEGEAAYAFIDATDPGADSLLFYLNGDYIGDDKDTSGTRSIGKNLGIFDDSGTFSYTAEVRDDDGGVSSTITRTFDIRNLPPTLFLDSPFPETVNEGDSVLLSLSATDPGKDAIEFLLNGEVIGTDNSGSGTRTFSENLNLFADDGTFDYRIEARDDDNGFSNTFFRNVTVNNVAPTFDFDIPTIKEGESALALFNATDPGADAISFFLNDENVGTDNSTSGDRAFTHDLGIFDDDGIFSYTAFAQDDDGGKSETITKTFKVENVAPTITDITKDFEIYPKQLFDFAATATDPGKDNLAYHWDFDGDGSYNDHIRDSGQWSFTDPGDYTVGLRVSDGDGGVTYDSFNVAVKPIKPPFVSRFTDIKGVEGDSDKFHFEFEVANWTDKEVGGVYVALTHKPEGKKVDESPFFEGAGVDINGRPYGPGRDPIPGTPFRLNTGEVIDATESAIEWSANPLISPAELTDVDSRDNVLDGFVFTVDDFDVEEFISFNMFLLDTDGNPIGTAGSGSEYGFATVDLVRLASLGSQSNFDQLPLSKLPDVFYDGVNQVTDTVADTVALSGLGALGLLSSPLRAALTSTDGALADNDFLAPVFGGRVETGATAAFLNPEDNKFNAPVNVSLLPSENPVDTKDVPEPSTILGLLGLAGASVLGLKRRRYTQHG